MGGGLKIPYALTPAVALEQRYAHMQSAIARKLPQLTRTNLDPSKSLHIACYGPSLRDTWRELQHPILSMSGATKFLADRGVIPDYHIEMDPRGNKVMTSLPAVPGVVYLVASVCDPAYFEALLEAGADVRLWHTVSSNWAQDVEWVRTHEDCQTCGAVAPAQCGHSSALVVSTGSTIGLGALQIGGVLGYSRFEIHGMDGSFARDGVRHADTHHGKTQKADITWDAGGVTYRTSKVMSNAVAESVNTAKNYPIITVWHGDGLTQALIREANHENACCADETEKRARLLQSAPRVLRLPPMEKNKLSFWDGLLSALTMHDLPDLVSRIPTCEARRVKARYNTGSVPLETSVLLRALCRYYRPEVIVEVGTFIGTSTEAMIASRALYTCDRDNDCVDGDDIVLTHPYQTSTQMLSEIQEPIDLFFFDGRIQPEDVPHIQRLSHEATIYACDDVVGEEKGRINIKILSAMLGRDCLFVPPHTAVGGRSTLGALLPVV